MDPNADFFCKLLGLKYEETNTFYLLQLAHSHVSSTIISAIDSRARGRKPKAEFSTKELDEILSNAWNLTSDKDSYVRERAYKLAFRIIMHDAEHASDDMIYDFAKLLENKKEDRKLREEASNVLHYFFSVQGLFPSLEKQMAFGDELSRILNNGAGKKRASTLTKAMAPMLLEIALRNERTAEEKGKLKTQEAETAASEERARKLNNLQSKGRLSSVSGARISSAIIQERERDGRSARPAINGVRSA